jgi:hypothetical protein
VSRAEPDGDTAIGIRDKASGFMLNVDHGSVWYYMQWKSGSSSRDFDAAFNYEHNQDGGSISGISLSLGILSVSYSGGPSHLQKSTGIFH